LAFSIEIHNNGLPGEGEIYSFGLDVGRITDNFEWGLKELISPVTLTLTMPFLTATFKPVEY